MKCFTLWASRALGADSPFAARAAFAFSWKNGGPRRPDYIDAGVRDFLAAAGVSASDFAAAAKLGDHSAAALLGGAISQAAFQINGEVVVVRYIFSGDAASDVPALARVARCGDRSPASFDGPPYWSPEYGPWKIVLREHFTGSHDPVCGGCGKFYVSADCKCPNCGWSAEARSFFAPPDGIYITGNSPAECDRKISDAISWMRGLVEACAEPDPDILECAEAILNAADRADDAEDCDMLFEGGFSIKDLDFVAEITGGVR